VQTGVPVCEGTQLRRRRADRRDGQHEVEDIPKVLEPILAGGATRSSVPGSSGDGISSEHPRIFGIRFFRLLVNLTTGYRVTDPTSGFFAINRS